MSIINGNEETWDFAKPRTWKDAKAHLKKTHRGFLNLVKDQIDNLSPSHEDRLRFKALYGTSRMDGPMRMSDMVAHYKLARLIAREVRDLRRVNDELNFYFLTLLADEGIMSDRKPCFAYRLLARKADKAMRRIGVDGFRVVEVQPLMNYPQEGKGRTLLGHVHILCWKHKDEPINSAADIRSELGYDKRRRNIAWTSGFGANPIHVQPITVQHGCPSFWAAYLLKYPHDAKNLIVVTSEAAETFPKAKMRLMSTTTGYRPELAMRMFELFGQMPLSSLVSGVGAGANILSRCRNRLKLWDEERLAKWKDQKDEPVPTFDERKFWKRTHKRRRRNYRPFFIDGPTVAERQTKRRF